jgi:hypothetical protein
MKLDRRFGFDLYEYSKYLRNRDKSEKGRNGALHTLLHYVSLTVLSAEKGNATVILSTSDWTEFLFLLDVPVRKVLVRPHTVV